MNRKELLQNFWQEQNDYYKVMIEYENTKYCTDEVVLSDSELYILKIIGQNPNTTITEIADQVRRTVSAVSQIVKRLIKKNLVKQNRNKENRRIYNLSLTELGEKLYEDSSIFDRNCMLTIFSKLSKFSDEELKNYITVQKKVKEALEEDLNIYKTTMSQRAQKENE